MVKKTKKKLTTKKKSRRRKSKNKFSFLPLILYGGLITLLVLSSYIVYCFLSMPDINEAVSRTRKPSAIIIAESGHEIASYGGVYSEVILAQDLPDYVRDAVVSTEDRRFYSHFGFDIISFTRAMSINLYHRRYAQGGSTISQQVAKNLFLTNQKNIKRKVQELLMAFWLENKFSKDQILTLYLNRVYMGGGAYGIEAASHKYFQKSAKHINLLEASILAGLLKAPSHYNPMASKKRALARAEVVLQNMVNTKKISLAEKQLALQMPLGNKKSQAIDGGKYFADWVYAETNAHLGEREDDINVYTTLDKEIQTAAERILREEIAKNRKNNVSNGAIVVLDMQGSVKAMVGGINYEKSQFNRAVQALRQSGSAFKTFVYLQALQNGYKPDDIIEDMPLSIDGWKPENADKKYYGKVSLNEAFRRSLNLATVNLAESLSRKDIIKLAQKLGVSSELTNNPSLSLGSSAVRVLDMAVAYSAIANGGFATWPHAINEIYSKDGYLLYTKDEYQPRRILAEKDVTEITKMLEDVINSGTGKKAKLPFFAAGKTGTSQDYRDAWFVGFSKDYVVAVWVGNDDNSPMNKISGAGLPAEIWQKVMLKTVNQ